MVKVVTKMMSQCKCDAWQKERQLIFKDREEGGRAMVMTDEERVLQ